MGEKEREGVFLPHSRSNSALSIPFCVPMCMPDPGHKAGKGIDLQTRPPNALFTTAGSCYGLITCCPPGPDIASTSPGFRFGPSHSSAFFVLHFCPLSLFTRHMQLSPFALSHLVNYKLDLRNLSPS